MSFKISVFIVYQYPQDIIIEDLAGKLKLKYSSVYGWFKNKRYRLKRGQGEKAQDKTEVQNVANLPTLDEARANIVGILNASASKLISILLAHSEKMSSLTEENSEKQPKE